MRKTVLKYVKGLSADANSWERRNHKKYGNIANVCKQIEYDMRHGVTKEELLASFSKIHTLSSYKTLRRDSGSMARLQEIEEHFAEAKPIMRPW
jgi:hypothetical protein